jgi:hypothetical protein
MNIKQSLFTILLGVGIATQAQTTGKTEVNNYTLKVVGDYKLLTFDNYVHGPLDKEGSTDFYFPTGSIKGGFPVSVEGKVSTSNIEVSFNHFSNLTQEQTGSGITLVDKGYWNVDHILENLAITFEWKQDLGASFNDLILVTKINNVWQKVNMLIRNFTQGFSLYIITQQRHPFSERDQEAHST